MEKFEIAIIGGQFIGPTACKIDESYFRYRSHGAEPCGKDGYNFGIADQGTEYVQEFQVSTTLKPEILAVVLMHREDVERGIEAANAK